MKLSRDAYEQLIAGDLAWLEKMPRTLEREHVIAIVKASTLHEYGPKPKARSCNRHDDCDAADAHGGPYVEHCHDEGCSECFGS